MPGTIGNDQAAFFALLDKLEIGVGIKEILCDGAVSSGFDFALEVIQIGFSIGCLGVKLGIGGYFDMKVVAGFCADEFNQFIGIAELTGLTPCRMAYHRAMPRYGGYPSLCRVPEYRGCLSRVDPTHDKCGAASMPEFALDFADGVKGAFTG